MKIKSITFLFAFLFTTNLSFSQQKFVTDDITHFWSAYDKIITSKDTLQQQQLLKELYFDKASDGLKSLMQVKNYSEKEYLNAILNYPKFWQSIRKNTENYKKVLPEVEKNIGQLKRVYPKLKPSTIYFSMGAFRSGGTTFQNQVLIGCELSLADSKVVTDELPEWRKPFYKMYNPIHDIGLLCTHEYVHTQQTEALDNLLCYSLREGVAEFISCLSTKLPSNTPSFKFGRNNETLVKQKFVEDLFIPNRLYNWLWGDNQNELKERDLGYYVGYRICENYYTKSKNKQKAIEELIELDYSNDAEVERIINESGFFETSIQQMYDDYEKSRPTIVSITPLNNDTKKVNSEIKQITLHFSDPMNTETRGFDYGPLGEEYVVRVEKVIGFSEDKKSFTFEVKLQPNRKYQSLVTSNFTSEKGIPLKPFLIEFETE
ncbi:MAG: Ig-like domain-containing protein [Flavobacteriales bacterium]|nr:Ig-like domain-containing protein [Flavobacteriales bacterium]